jgi:hypothetical protein
MREGHANFFGGEGITSREIHMAGGVDAMSTLLADRVPDWSHQSLDATSHRG